MHVPRHSLADAIVDAEGGFIAQQLLCLANICLGVAHITGAEVTVAGRLVVGDAGFCEGGFQSIEQGVEGGSVTQGHVVNLVLGFRLGGGGQEVDLHHVFDKAKVSTGFSIAIDEHFIAVNHCGGPLWNHGGVSTVGVLPLAEDIEVAQADGVEVVGAGEYVRVEFVDVFGNRIRRQRLANAVFDFGQARVVAVGGAGGGVGKALYAFIF